MSDGKSPADPIEHRIAALRTCGDFDAALRECETAILQQPDAYCWRHLRACVLHDAGRTDDAISAYREAAHLADFAEAHHSIGSRFLDYGLYAEAVEHYRAATELEPEDRNWWHNLGVALRESGDLEGAVGAFRAALQLEPESPDALAVLGDALLNSGRVDEGRAALRTAVRWCRVSARTRLVAACDGVHSAIHDLETALSIDADDADVRFELDAARQAAGPLAAASAARREEADEHLWGVPECIDENDAVRPNATEEEP